MKRRVISLLISMLMICICVLSVNGEEVDRSNSGVVEVNRSHHYYCTPKDAQIIGSLGVDGIHYCTLPSFGTKIFIVSPLPFDTHHVIPIAEDFLTFLYLISYFRGTQLLDQIPYTEKTKIETMMRKKKEKESLEQKEILQRICMITKNVVFPEDPYEYVIRLYKNFPYEKIEYTERYYQIIAE